MAGMAILLMCVMQVDDSGWRSSHAGSNSIGATQTSTPYSPAGTYDSSIQRTSAVEPWPGVQGTWGDAATRQADELVNRAERALQGASVGMGSTIPSGSTSTWSDLEDALRENLPATRSPERTPGQRLRRSTEASLPPLPPSGPTYGASGLSDATTVNRGTSSRFAERTAFAAESGGDVGGIPPERGGDLEAWLNEDPLTNSGPPVGSASSGMGLEPRRGAVRSAQMRDAGAESLDVPLPPDDFSRRAAELRRRSVVEGANPNSSGRDVLFEGNLDSDGVPERRYLNPGARESYETGLTRQETIPVPRRSADNWPAPPDTDSRTLPPNDPRSSVGLPGQEAGAPATSASTVPATAEVASDDPARRWWPLTMAILGLFGSIGFNVYLGWIAWDLYTRYREAVDDVHELEVRLDEKQLEPNRSRRPAHAMATN